MSPSLMSLARDMQRVKTSYILPANYRRRNSAADPREEDGSMCKWHTTCALLGDFLGPPAAVDDSSHPGLSTHLLIP